MDNPVYFAGGYYYPEKKMYDKRGRVYHISDFDKPRQFDLVSSTGGKDLPFLTHNSNGLKLTSHHANLYRLNDDMKTAKMVQHRCMAVSDIKSHEGVTYAELDVSLSEEQIERIKNAIEADYFYD